METENELTTIPIFKVTRDRLKGFGNKGDTWDCVLNDMMDGLEKEKNEAKK